jgi:hypothetical protein
MAGRDYPFVRAWGVVMGSGSAYIERQVEKARRDKAPPDAIYERTERGEKLGWATYRQVTSPDTRVQMDRILKIQFGIEQQEPDPRCMLESKLRAVAVLERQLAEAQAQVAVWRAKVVLR